MTVWYSVRAAISSLTDAMGRFVLINVMWMAAAALAVTAGTTFRPAYVLGLAIVPISCGMMRMAAHAVRKNFPSFGHFREGFAHRFWAHLGIGAAEAVLLSVSIVNLGVGMGGESLLFALIAVVAGYVALATVAFAIASWPLLLDPKRRAMPVPAVLRLGVAVVLKRPIRLVLIALIEVGLLAIVSQIVILGIFLPSFCALIAAYFVLPIADTLRSGAPPATLPRRTHHHG